MSMTVTEQKLAAIFNEWASRYARNPEEFSNILGDDGQPIADYGEACARYFHQLAAEMDDHCLSGTDLITGERCRQMEAEKYTADHDDTHDIGELCSAADCYLHAADCLANAAVFSPQYAGITAESLKAEFEDGKIAAWPWDLESLKISPDPVRNLIKAGALIAAEVDRLKRRRIKALNGEISDASRSVN